MGNVNMLGVLAGAAAFFVVGMVWYGLLFSRVWQRAAGLTADDLQRGNPVVIFGLCFAFELLIALMLGHNIARTNPQPHVIMMMAIGFGATIMTPAIGICYLFLRKPGTLFAIDAGHFIVGMAAMGGVFVWLR
ncbi:MAG: DUF1761 domain-containing protein [Pontixanthobacter sp.]